MNGIEGWLLPALSPSADAAIRIGFGITVCLQLMEFLPRLHVYLGSETFGGFGEPGRITDIFGRPFATRAIGAIWGLAALGLITNHATLLCALLCYVLAKYYFVDGKYSSILAGAGAFGRLQHWLSALVLALVFAAEIDPGGGLRSVVVWTFRLDFALIIFSAGSYKMAAGYASNQGVEWALVNPWVSYWSALFRNVAPSNGLLRLVNHGIYLAEAIGGILLVFPLTAPFAALYLALAFFVVAVFLRLSFLGECVAICCLLFVPLGGSGDMLLRSILPPEGGAVHVLPTFVVRLLTVCAYAYGITLPIAFAGMSYNFFAKRRLPGMLQPALECWTKFFGLAIWRVVTVDYTTFFVTVWRRTPGGEAQIRFENPIEITVLTNIFAGLRHHRKDDPRFRDRLLRYARTLSTAAEEQIVFRYMQLKKAQRHFDLICIAEFLVDTSANTIEVQLLDPSDDLTSAVPGSRMFSTAQPGSYAPR